MTIDPRNEYVILDVDIEALAKVMHADVASCEWSRIRWFQIPEMEWPDGKQGCRTCYTMARKLLDSGVVISRSEYEKRRHTELKDPV